MLSSMASSPSASSIWSAVSNGTDRGEALGVGHIGVSCPWLLQARRQMMPFQCSGPYLIRILRYLLKILISIPDLLKLKRSKWSRSALCTARGLDLVPSVLMECRGNALCAGLRILSTSTVSYRTFANWLSQLYMMRPEGVKPGAASILTTLSIWLSSSNLLATAMLIKHKCLPDSFYMFAVPYPH